MVIASIAVSYVSSSNLPYIPLLFTYFSKKKKKQKTKKQKTKKQKQKQKQKILSSTNFKPNNG